jgi:N-formylglutamate amidohydrolase
VPPVSFFFPDRTRSVSEAGAAFLVAQLQGRPHLELDREEQQELLDTLRATTDLWPEEDQDALHELQLALAVQTSRPEQSDT